MNEKKKRMTFWINEKQVEGLKALSLATRIKQADFVREGIEMVLERYAKDLKKVKKGGEKK